MKSFIDWLTGNPKFGDRGRSLLERETEAGDDNGPNLLPCGLVPGDKLFRCQDQMWTIWAVRQKNEELQKELEVTKRLLKHWKRSAESLQEQIYRGKSQEENDDDVKRNGSSLPTRSFKLHGME